MRLPGCFHIGLIDFPGYGWRRSPGLKKERKKGEAQLNSSILSSLCPDTPGCEQAPPATAAAVTTSDALPTMGLYSQTATTPPHKTNKQTLQAKQNTLPLCFLRRKVTGAAVGCGTVLVAHLHPPCTNAQECPKCPLCCSPLGQLLPIHLSSPQISAVSVHNSSLLKGPNDSSCLRL